MTSFLLLYASTSGNTEMVVSQVAHVLRQKKQPVTVQRAECSQPEDLIKHDVTVLACGTYGHGLLEYNMEQFLKAVKTSTSSPLKGRFLAVIGLGDDKYDSYYNMESAKILETFVEKQGGKRIVESLRINKSPVPHLAGRVTEWAEQLIDTPHPPGGHVLTP